jgi:uncharacterized protein (UPF0212 family)
MSQETKKKILAELVGVANATVVTIEPRDDDLVGLPGVDGDLKSMRLQMAVFNAIEDHLGLCPKCAEHKRDEVVTAIRSLVGPSLQLALTNGLTYDQYISIVRPMFEATLKILVSKMVDNMNAGNIPMGRGGDA